MLHGMHTDIGHEVYTPMARRLDSSDRRVTVLGFRPEFAVMMSGNCATRSASTIVFRATDTSKLTRMRLLISV